jgi:hypothetical protein
MGLSAHLRREGSHTLSAKTPSPVQRRHEAVAEGFLSVKASPRGKTRSTRVTSLSAKGLNPVVILPCKMHVVLLDEQVFICNLQLTLEVKRLLHFS